MGRPSPRPNQAPEADLLPRVEVGAGGCWHEDYVCNAKAVPGGYYCDEHLSWSMTNVLAGGDTGKILIAREPDSDPGLEQERYD